MKKRILLVGLEPREADYIKSALGFGYLFVCYSVVPKAYLKEGRLYVQSQTNRNKFLPVDTVIFYGIYENDFDFITLLALWNGQCLPNPIAMLNLRQRIPALARVLPISKFGTMERSMVVGQQEFTSESEMVAKWGVWHCGEDKAKFNESWHSTETSVIESFVEGNAVRIMKVGKQYWQIQLTGESWLKSLHGEGAHFMEIDRELLADAQQITSHFEMEIAGIDYIVNENEKHILEVNHIPNITVF